MLSIKFIPDGFEGEENTDIINQSAKIYLYTPLCTGSCSSAHFTDDRQANK